MNVSADTVINDWVDLYADTLYNYIALRIRNREDADDILQDSFVAAWKGYEKFDHNASEKTWLFAIVKNKLVDYYRKQGRNPAAFTGDDIFFNEKGFWKNNMAPGAWNNADASLNEKDFMKIFDSCGETLSERLHRAFTMKYIDNYDADFICKVMNITASNYWVMLHRSKLMLRACLEKNWFGDKKIT